MTHHQTGSAAERLALRLGWFSIGLGLAELVAPREMARLIGANGRNGTTKLLRGYGAREIASGVGLLAQPRNPAWIWSRVAGDAIDLATLQSLRADDDRDRRRRRAAAAAVLGVTALDVICAVQSSRANAQRREPVHVERSTTINRPIEQVYAFWSDFQNFPRFMRHVEAVRTEPGGRSHWRVTGPAGMTVDWTAEVVEARENERLSWRTVEGSDVEHSGIVEFAHAPGARGTEVRVSFDYKPPAGRVGRAMAWIWGEDPDQQVREDLRRFKQIVETGEVPLSDGPALRRPARPVERPEGLRQQAGVQS